MAQAKGTQETDEAGEQMVATAQAASEAMSDVVADLVDAAQDETERMLDAARDLADQAPAPMLKLVIGRAAPAMEDLVRVERELAAFWLDATREHSRRTMATLQRLATARDLPTALTIQSEYLQETMSSLHDTFARQMELTGHLAQRMLGHGEDERAAA
jgi:hypothetical protein